MFELSKMSIWVLGLLQAAGVLAYGALIMAATFGLEKLGPLIAPVIAVLSVLVAGMGTLARPIYLFFFAKKPREAFILIGWTIFWLALSLVVASFVNSYFLTA